MGLSETVTADRPLVLVGAGKMGGALLSGWLDGGLRADAVRVVDPAPSAELAALLANAGAAAPSVEPPAAATAGVLVLAVKPQQIAEMLPQLRSLVDGGSVAMSIAAGTRLQTLTEGIGSDRVIRAMPNTPAQIGMGVTVAVGAAGVTAADRDMATTLLSSVGDVEWIDDEALMDAVTAVSGSGPAYVFFLAECLADAGVDAGLDPELARRLADATVAGAGGLIAASNDPPATLRQNVTSPGGTTAAALEVLQGAGGLGALMNKAVAAAKKRAGELG
jgi:pyrroline-5-carboxylate reductase